MIKLDNGVLSLTVSEKGAEPVSLVKHSVEYLWNADANYWNRHAPILFPIVGKLREDKCRFGMRECTMKQHGFARDSHFVPGGVPGELIFAEKPSKDVYPFDFDLSVCYELTGNHLKAMWKVVNTGSEEMLFQIGAHPGFVLPQYDLNDEIHGFFRMYDADGKLIRPLVFSLLEDGLRVPLYTPKSMLKEELPITSETFAHGALLIEESQVAAVELLDKHGTLTLRVDCPQAEALGLWAPYKKGCPFVCIEPWCGIADAYNFTGDFSARKYAHRLGAGKEYGFEYGVTVF